MLDELGHGIADLQRDRDPHLHPRIVFKVSDLGSQVSGFGLRVSGFEFRDSGFGFRVSGFRFRV